MSSAETQSRHWLRFSVGEAIALIALVVTVFVSLNGWVVLPVQLNHVSQEVSRQGTRIDLIEKSATERAETLIRIDERTKRIEDSLRTLHPEISQSSVAASTNP